MGDATLLGPGAGKRPRRRKLLLLIGAPLLAAASCGALWFAGVLPPGMRHSGKGQQAAGPTYVNLPDIVANLDTPQRHPAYVKLKARLELARPEDQALVTAAMPRIQDLFTTYLREMRPDELRGSMGTYRLREELIARIDIAAAPAHVANVLFTEMIVQ